MALEFLQPQAADHRVRAEPARHRDPHDLPEGRLPGTARGDRGGARLPRRVPAAAPPRDRARTARGRRARASSRPTRSNWASTSARSTCAVLAGYPGTIASTWQRAGRAGRRSGRSAAVLVASSAPLDQFIVRHPSYFFDASPEHALINPDNLHVLLDHVKCAAFELPFQDDERFGRTPVSTGGAAGARARKASSTRPTGSGTGRTSRIRPMPSACASITSDNFVIVDVTRRAACHRRDRLHERAVDAAREGHLHPRRRSCTRWSGWTIEGRKAYVRRSTATTTPTPSPTRRSTSSTSSPREPAPRGADDAGSRRRGSASRRRPREPSRGDRRRTGRAVRRDSAHGEVHVVSRVVGFKKIKFYTNENVGSGDLDLPEQQMHTTSYWLTVPRAVLATLPYAPDDRRDGVSGLAYAMRSSRAVAADVRSPGPRRVDRHRRRRATGGWAPRRHGLPASRCARLHLRQLPGRHRLQRAALHACTTPCWRRRSN